MIELKNVCFSFNEKRVLENFNLHISDNKITCLMGPSGYGKTTIMRIAAGLIKPQSGEVVRNDITGQSFVFQENRLFDCSVISNFTALGIDEKRARDYLDKVGLLCEADSMPSSLSGGMARRVAIARALAFEADIYFMDEPISGLDKKNEKSIMEVIKHELKGKTALIITHDQTQAEFLTDIIIDV